MTHTSTEQERAEFEAWYAGVRQTPIKRMDFEAVAQLDDMKSAYWFAWQAARRAQVVPDASIHNKNLNGFIAFANQVEFSNPRSASLKRKFILATRDAIIGFFGDNVSLQRKVDSLAAAPQPPEDA